MDSLEMYRVNIGVTKTTPYCTYHSDARKTGCFRYYQGIIGNECFNMSNTVLELLDTSDKNSRMLLRRSRERFCIFPIDRKPVLEVTHKKGAEIYHN